MPSGTAIPLQCQDSSVSVAHPHMLPHPLWKMEITSFSALSVLDMEFSAKNTKFGYIRKQLLLRLLLKVYTVVLVFLFSSVLHVCRSDSLITLKCLCSNFFAPICRAVATSPVSPVSTGPLFSSPMACLASQIRPISPNAHGTHKV